MNRRAIGPAAAVLLVVLAGCVGPSRTTLVEVAGNGFVFVEPTDQIFVETNSTPPPAAQRVSFTVDRAGVYLARWDPDPDQALSYARPAPGQAVRADALHSDPVAYPFRYQFCGANGPVFDVGVTVAVGLASASHRFEDLQPCPPAEDA